ncbi:MAG: hypothetical protein WD602_01320 [Actinomycetota bacterium]
MAAWLLAAGLFALDYPSDFEDMFAWHLHRLSARECLAAATTAADPCLNEIFPNQPGVFERSRYLEQIGWGGFTEDGQDPPDL